MDGEFLESFHRKIAHGWVNEYLFSEKVGGLIPVRGALGHQIVEASSRTVEEKAARRGMSTESMEM